MRPARAAAAVAVVAAVAAALVGCGQKAAPDVDPAPADNKPASAAPAQAPPSTPAPSTTVDPGTLPQTQDRPDPAAPEFTARMKLLYDAIVADDPAMALPTFFPLSAYVQVKDIKDPTGDWNSRLVGTFTSDIHQYHRQLVSQLGAKAAPGGKVDPASVPFTGVTVPAGGVQWINPKTEYNKGGYFRVFDSKLNYTVNGKPASFNVKSMISWRGQWYVVHLIAIR